MSLEEYEKLKTFVGCFYDWFMAGVSRKPEAHPLAVAARLEEKSLANAKRGLQMAINDCIERSSDWTPEEVAKANAAFARHGTLTLSEVRARYSKKYLSLLKRGRIRTAVEYYLLKGVIDGGSVEQGAGEEEKILAMLQEYEQRQGNT